MQYLLVLKSSFYGNKTNKSSFNDIFCPFMSWEKKSHKILNPETREAIHCHKAKTFVRTGIFPKAIKTLHSANWI